MSKTTYSQRRYTGMMKTIQNQACSKPGYENFGKPGINIGGHGWFTTQSCLTTSCHPPAAKLGKRPQREPEKMNG